jgi:hypothetical protein
MKEKEIGFLRYDNYYDKIAILVAVTRRLLQTLDRGQLNQYRVF